MEYKSIGYKKLIIVCFVIAIVASIVSSFVFADTIETSDQIMDNTLKVLIFLQKYSWPVITLVFVYALYQFYVIGSEVLEHKLLGRRLLIGIAFFMTIIQCLPLAYAFVLIK